MKKRFEKADVVKKNISKIRYYISFESGRSMHGESDKMDYKSLIDPELKKSARRFPFNRGVVIGGNIYQEAEWRFIKPPEDIEEKEIWIQKRR